MTTHPFLGRLDELRKLKELQKKSSASLVILQGRRRVGKSRLIEEFAKNQRYYRLTGIAPGQDSDDQAQRDEFARQMGEQGGLSGLRSGNWGDLFTLLAKQTEEGRVVILFDEISWMGSKDPTFLGKLKNAWDTQFSKNPKLMLILCGSVSSWIQKNIISSTAFLGRPSLYLTLDELPLKDCSAFWGKREQSTSVYEKLKSLSVTGGVPWYLELMDPRLEAEENIRRLCFSPDGALFNEFDRIFSDIFGRRSEIYRKIVSHLVLGSANLNDLLTHSEKAKTGDFSAYLNDLVLAGFVSRDYTWHLASGELSKLSSYRLKDNYVRFYLKYIQPNRGRIEKKAFEKTSLASLPGWETMLALQFENLVINNARELINLLGTPLDEVVFFNPFFQRKTKRQSGCQIDLLIQTKFNTLYLCEIKFSKHKVPSSIIDDVRKKVARLKIPKHFSYRPVLIHVNGVDEDVAESGFFSDIINFQDFLT